MRKSFFLAVATATQTIELQKTTNQLIDQLGLRGKTQHKKHPTNQRAAREYTFHFDTLFYSIIYVNTFLIIFFGNYMSLYKFLNKNVQKIMFNFWEDRKYDDFDFKKSILTDYEFF
mgnify:CR=1 FL=1